MDKYEKHVNDILEAVGKDDVDRSEIEKELKNYVEEFRLTVGEAKKLIARKHGANIAVSSEGIDKSVRELNSLDKNVNMLCRVVFAAEKTIKQEGEDKVIISGILGDETGTVPFTYWEKGDMTLAKGDVVKIEHAYITQWREQNQVNIGNRGKLAKVDKSMMPEFKGTGNGAGGFTPARECKINDLGNAVGNVSVIARIMTMENREVNVSGENKEVMSGTMADETGKVSFTCWGKTDIKVGDAIKVNNGYLRKWREMPQLNFDAGNVEKSDEELPDETELSKVDDSLMPEFNGSGSFKPTQLCKVIDIGKATGNISIVARIMTMEIREVNVSGENKEVMSGTMADETGKVSFTCWGKAKMKEGDAIKVNSGYLRKWRGMPQLNFDVSNVEKTDEKLPEETELAKPVPVTINHLARIGGMVDAAVDGVILDIRQGSGLVSRCPECNRVLQKNACRIHGEVEGNPDLRTKAVLDDGTGAMTVIMNRIITELLLEKSMEQCIEEAKEAMDYNIIQDQLFQKLVAQPVTVTGNVTSDEFGLMLIASGTDVLKIDPIPEARKMLEAIL